MTIRQYFNRIGIYLMFYNKPFYDKIRDAKLVYWAEKRRIYRRDMKNLNMWRDWIHKYAEARLMGPDAYYNTYYEIFELAFYLRRLERKRDKLIKSTNNSKFLAVAHEIIEVREEINNYYRK